MASIIKETKNFAESSFKGGMGTGALTGITQGLIGMLGFHQFFARVGGGMISAAIVKNSVDKRIILVESVKEGIYQLMAGE